MHLQIKNKAKKVAKINLNKLADFMVRLIVSNQKSKKAKKTNM